MKKIVLAFLLISCSAYAQMDTLHLGDREPTYYYWDTNWWDHYFYNYPAPSWSMFDSLAFTAHYVCRTNRAEFARCFFIDSTMKIIGVAAPAEIHVSDNVVDTSIANRLPEFFRVYRAEGNTMYKLAEARWDHLKPKDIRHAMCVGYEYRYVESNGTYVPEWYETIAPVYEAYFNQPIIVSDSFYVSATGNNNYKVAGDTTFYNPNNYVVNMVPEHPYTYYFATYEIAKNPSVSCKPQYYRRKFHTPGEPSFGIGEPDTLWGFNEEGLFRSFFNFFPIIDTSYGHMPPANDTCMAPTGLGLMENTPDCITLRWDDMHAQVYEVSIGTGGSPDEGTISHHPTTFVSFSDLDTGTLYTVWVRSLCGSDRVSGWSDSIVFMPGNDPLSVSSTADRFSYVMPNPASESVTVASSFLIDEVDIYTLSGQCVASRKVGGISTSIDISSLPSGTYIIRIATIRGVAHKKLVVKR